ncbi:malto-oligosyltrehalose synthase [Devosia sp. PTR5]|uniref:Malto-oligosyltrehalose synthase n=1 Tax=Devosia oryzisoli TaxID=2774138 RepID=A0A927ISZ7_9HYPH|nr:malto-oligosyltrehalose synthase [Devosia oryzisoli]
MKSSPPVATYRIQLREGVNFAHVERHLDYLAHLGVSHLYLSPIFTAGQGSTHGYDVVDPTEIEPGLGGRTGFERLARAAHDKGLGIILDIVPNHTAFTLDNPWLRDVLRDGRSSPFARYFDIDWEAGPLVLPWLPETFATMLAAGKLRVEGDDFVAGDLRVPLAPGSGTGAPEAVHERQHWRLHHWELERDGITHRRFFNVTSLIGMRVEDPEVFAATHSLIFDLVRQGLVDGLRVDHIDGLADPKAYLDQLAAELPDTPVWIEKILVGEETLAQGWKTVGTTGYEAARMIARLLTSETGIGELDQAWQAYCGPQPSFEVTLRQSKADVLGNELSAEVHQLVGLARAALAGDGAVEPGPEGLREAIVVLLTEMSRYRTYIDANGAGPDDRQIIDTIVGNSRTAVRSHRVLEALARHLVMPQTADDRRLVVRLQQVSGALLAKAQEDTAGFRWTRFLAANEVGAEPAEPTVTDREANAFLAARTPWDMTLTSTHDTKRSEDSRMRLVALSHHPRAFASLVAAHDHLAPPTLPRLWRWYVMQSVLALWGEPPDTLTQRLTEHLQKAMREAKLTSFWTRPDEPLETAASQFAAALCDAWEASLPAEVTKLLSTGDALGLAQQALKCLLPGFPDIYRGSEGAFYALTDPDNRLPIDWTALGGLAAGQGFGAEKAELTRVLLDLRRSHPPFFQQATARITHADGSCRLERSHDGRTLVLSFGEDGPRSARPLWVSRAHPVVIHWME